MMTPEHWKEIERIFHAALQRPKTERAAFIASACVGDDALAREVESLLARADAASSLLERPAGGPGVDRCPRCLSPIVGPQETCPACGIDLSSITTAEADSRTLTIPAHLAGSNTVTDEAQPVPERIGEFRILSRIGRGGSGTVYLAYQESMRRHVALKVLDESAAFSGNELTRFEREAWIAGRLTHPSIVRVYDQGVAGTLRYIVMELVEGRSLAAFIEEARDRRQAATDSDSGSRRRHVRRMVELFVSVADALDYVHRQGIIHRDIKPLNLLLAQKDSHLLLTDFGLAQDERASRVTRRGDFMGTIRYMSPEQLLAQRARVDLRTDLWSFGVSLYEAVTLDLPYAGDSEEAYISAVATKEPLPARQRDRTLPRDLETVLMKCLERDPDRRYVSAAELRDDLQRFLTDQPVKARRAGIVLKMARLGKRHRWPVAAGTLAAILIAVSLPIMLRKWDEARDRARLRSTLEQVIATGSPPERIQSDWNVLAVSLRQQIEQDPHGPLANLARSAATRVVAHIGTPNNLNLLNDASFTPPWALVGLVSRPPPVNLKVTMFEIGVPLHILVQVEAAVGAGQWTSIGWVRTVRKPGSSADSAICRFSLPRQALSVGSNRVELRAIVTFHDLLETERAGRYELSYQCSQPGRLELPGDLAKRPAVTQFTRMLKPMSIRLFERYPDDLPQEVDPNTTVGDIDRWFKPERFRLVQVRVPDRGAGSALVGSVVYPWNSARKICAPQELAAPAGFATGLEMSGVFTVTPPVPIAATVDWRPSDSATAMLSFPLILGQGTFRFDATPGPGSALPAAPLLFTPNGVFSPLKVGGGVEPVPVPIEGSPIYYTSVFQRDKDIIMSKMMAKDPMGGPPSYATSVGPSDQFTMGVIRFRDPVWLSALLPETSTPGVLHLRPARDLALMNYFERYLGDLTRPVSLEVLTLTFQGQGWVNDPGCTSPTQKK